jgi:hypothetical protein
MEPKISAAEIAGGVGIGEPVAYKDFYNIM